MISLTRLTELTPLLSLADIKANLIIEHSDDDSLIQRLSLAVTDLLDGHTGETGIALVEQTLQFVMPYTTVFTEAPVGPVKSITSAVCLDCDGEELAGMITVTSSGLNQDCFRIQDYVGEGFPEYIKITYEAGPIAPVSSPPSIIQAAHLMVGHYYENRENSTPISVETIPDNAKVLIARQKKGWAA